MDRNILRVDNEDLVTEGVVSGLTDGLSGSAVNLEATGKAVVDFISANQTNFDLQTLTGDYTALVNVRKDQVVSFATSYGIQSAYSLPVKVHIEQGGNAHFSSKLLLVDPVSANSPIPNLYAEGVVSSLNDLYVGEQGQMVVTSTANTRTTDKVVAPVGTISFTTINVVNTGSLKHGLDTDNQVILKAVTSISVSHLTLYLENTCKAPSSRTLFLKNVLCTFRSSILCLCNVM